MARLIPLLSVMAAAQEPIHVDLRLVEAHVVARDSRGSVGDLKESDFKIFDNGKEQRIAVFKISKAGAADPARAPVPGVFSNRQKLTSSATVLLIDTLNTEPADQFSVKTNMLEMLGTLVVKEPIALYVLGEKITVLQDFTTDVEALRKALEAWRPALSTALSGSTTPMPRKAGRGGAEAGARQGVEDIRQFYMEERARGTVDGFELIAQQLMGVPGRKNVVWVSSAFPAGFLKDKWERLHALNQADIAIYPVDTRGLLVNGRLGSSTDALAAIADQTGGQAFYNTNDVAGAITHAMDDAQVSYTLGFYAPGEKPDGLYHELRVKTDRKGVDLRYRKGYFDGAEASENSSSLATLRRAMAASLDATAIGLAVAAAPREANYHVAVLIDFRDFSLGNKDGRWKGGADLALESQKADGSMVNLVSKSLTFDMTDDAYAARQKDGFTIEEDVPAGKDVNRIRVAVVDRTTGAVGSVSAKIIGK